jgi:hypothetical protein
MIHTISSKNHGDCTKGGCMKKNAERSISLAGPRFKSFS